MIFKRSVQRYGRTPSPVTPFQRAGQLWDERLGSARVQARNWRLMAVGGLLVSAGLSGGLVWQTSQSRLIPYVVEVDRLGEPRAVTAAERAYRPTDPQIAWHLAQFIRNVRGISLDPVVMRQNWLSAYDFATGRGASFLNDFARETDPFGAIGTRTVSVQVTSIVRVSDSSFQVKWVERAFERGNPAGQSHWTAILNVINRPPASVETLRRNPLGLYVNAVDWSQELEPDSPAPAGTDRAQPTGTPAAEPISRQSPTVSPLQPGSDQ